MNRNFNHKKLRKMWFKFFTKNNHKILKSKQLIPENNNSLLWINSGVATLKNKFLNSDIQKKYRYCNIQKCLRTNDFKNVGITMRHHIFFEMLGNFSINDYSRKDAIIFAWKFLTSKDFLNFKKEKLYVTVYKKDYKTIDIWKKHTNINNNNIIHCERNTNFWRIGKGPCGPNTEIFYDRGAKYDSNNIVIIYICVFFSNINCFIVFFINRYIKFFFFKV